MAARIISLVTVLLLAGALCAATTLADGDPASDTLLGAAVFYPYAPPVSHSVQTTLNAETAEAKRAGFPIKVALIGRPLDLGVIPDLFGKPQAYANFLEQEISFQGQEPLLVVMPSGYGVVGMSRPATVAADRLPTPSGATPTALAQAAEVAVARLAHAEGHPITAPTVAGASSSGGGSSLPVILGLVVAALLVSGALVVLRRRQPASGRPRR
ncbi:MAG: hypothetical protein QOF83_1269 [Solirubrobacteraceae bacterium]|jgi:hypothetical protein|nr:hypothetical protein [Solirubrobacteraceae bacterium]